MPAGRVARPMRRFPSTVSGLKIHRPCSTQPMPSSTRSYGGGAMMSRPSRTGCADFDRVRRVGRHGRQARGRECRGGERPGRASLHVDHASEGPSSGQGRTLPASRSKRRTTCVHRGARRPAARSPRRRAPSPGDEGRPSCAARGPRGDSRCRCPIASPAGRGCRLRGALRGLRGTGALPFVRLDRSACWSQCRCSPSTS